MKGCLIMTGLGMLAAVTEIYFGEGDITYSVYCFMLAAIIFHNERKSKNMIKKKENVIFGKIVRKRLIEMDMTQRELAAEAEIKEGYLSRILNGDRNGRKYRRQICEVLGLDFETVLKKIAA